MKRISLKHLTALLLSVSLLAGMLTGCGKPPVQEQTEEQTVPTAAEQQEPEIAVSPVEPLARPQLLTMEKPEHTVTPSVPAYKPAADLSNVTNLDRFYLSETSKQQLAEQLFTLRSSYASEFFQQYEENRYYQIPNFVTVDSLMHTYHLYFSLLLSRTEKSYLSDALKALSQTMLETAMAQHDNLVGTPWEEAATRNVAYFAVGCKLLEQEITVPDYARELVQQEVDAILEAAGIMQSPLTADEMDYTQFKPRGYYAEDPVLEPYFRAMMWYGQVNFGQETDSLTRSAVLLTMALHETGFENWEQIYTVTAFFAGTSDDLGYYEYAPALEKAYGAMPTTAQLTENEAAYEQFQTLASDMRGPAINSIPVMWYEPDPRLAKKGFRFMGQRFTIDAAIMQELVYRQVEENSQGKRRMLPDFLDVPAALGSQLAVDLLREQGEMDYQNYEENLKKLQTVVQNAPEHTWTTSLYSSWLYTLQPLLWVKGEGYPSYMTSTQWLKKDLETYAGSYTELKHDTVLYAKQIMAEMGGGPQEIVDDRGYVDPEVEVYRRFAMLAEQTAQGLKGYGWIGEEELENLSRLGELANRLMVISEKELRNELLTDEEYELIRGYGGTLEHFWEEAVKEQADGEWFGPQEIPAALVTDIATDPNGTVLQIANGKPAEILVLIPMDGEIHLASGMAYDFYQFPHPMNDRLTDRSWRQMIGQWQSDDGRYHPDDQVEKPWWTTSYWSEK